MDATRILLLLFSVSLIQASLTEKKYSINIEHVQVCPSNVKSIVPLKNLKFVAFNRTTKVLSVDYSLPRPIDKTIGLKVVLERFSDGGWRRVPFIDNVPDICKNLGVIYKQLGTVWVKIFANSGAEYPEKCPIPAGNYSMKDFIFEVDDLNLPLWTGKLRFHPMLVDTKSNEVFLCFGIYFSLTEMFSTKKAD